MSTIAHHSGKASTQGKLRILVVDDQLIVRATVRAALEYLDRPFVVIEAETGEEALAIMRNVPVSIVFCDIYLPGISGPEALAHAYTHRGERPFMVLMSTKQSKAVLEVGQRIGVYEFLAKPFLASSVLSTIQAHERMLKTTRALVVDDSAVARRLMSRILAKSRFSLALAEASSGAEAISLMAGAQYDVVFLDLNMPALNGFETAALLLRANPQTQIVIVSTEQQTSIVRTAQYAGAFAFLRKPFDEHDVDAVLHSAFNIQLPSIARETHAIFADTPEAEIAAGSTPRKGGTKSGIVAA